MVSIGPEEIATLAGREGFSNRFYGGLPPAEIAALCVRLIEAKRHGRLSTRQFLELRGKPLREFCREQGFTGFEVRLAQRLVEFSWAMWRASKINGRAAAAQQRRFLQ